MSVAKTMPAVVPDQDGEQPERTYQVAKTVQRVLGYGPGETFTARLPAEQERLLLASGALTVIEAPAAEPEPDADLPDGVEDLGGGWYEVDGRKVHGRKALDAALTDSQQISPQHPDPSPADEANPNPQE